MKKQIRKTPIVFLSLILITFCSSCDDFIEKDLETEIVKIMAPADSSTISTTTVTFWWESIEGALEYNIQVVSPSFKQVQKLWADSIVTGDKLMLSLVPGNFEWRIKALNGSSETSFVTAAFSIDSTLNITNENIILVSPGNGAITNKLQQVFRWNKLYSANDYNFRITNAAGESLEDIITLKTEASHEFLTDGVYTWSVRGQNEISNTLYSSFTLQIDTQTPEAPILNTPLNNAVVPDDVSFSWTRAHDTGSALYDSLYVFSDISLTNKKLSVKLDQTSYEDSFEAGIYYWYVKTCDAAGNIGDRSSVFSFVKN